MTTTIIIIIVALGGAFGSTQGLLVSFATTRTTTKTAFQTSGNNHGPYIFSSPPLHQPYAPTHNNNNINNHNHHYKNCYRPYQSSTIQPTKTTLSLAAFDPASLDTITTTTIFMVNLDPFPSSLTAALFTMVHPHDIIPNIASSTILEGFVALSDGSSAAMDDVTASSSSSSWRQYVPLVVSGGILLDIVLGSPAANSVLGILRQQQEQQDQQEPSTTATNAQPMKDDALSTTSSSSSFWNPFGTRKNPNDDMTTTLSKNKNNQKERIDTVAFAQQALDKASATMELRRYLDENQSDWEKIQTVQRQLNDQLAAYDEEQNRRKEQPPTK